MYFVDVAYLHIATYREDEMKNEKNHYFQNDQI
jgi:hypothetical protein